MRREGVFIQDGGVEDEGKEVELGTVLAESK